MAIEPLKIGNTASSLNRLDKPHNNGIQDFDHLKRKDIDEPDKDDKSKKKDRVSLSEQALTQLRQAEDLNQSQTVKEVSSEDLKILKEQKQNFENNLLEFRGFNETAKKRDLTADNFQRISELRSEIKDFVGDENITDDKILQKSDEVLSSLAAETDTLLDKLNQGNITGNEFQKLDRINSSFNKANGFGKDFRTEEYTSTPRDFSEIEKSFSKNLEDIGDRKLSTKELSVLKEVQQELSAVSGYNLRVTDRNILGSEGLVA